ncbi:hypothetical protein Gotur_018054 [Gossypium turneri]
MDQYQKVEKPKAETPINENELRIIVQERMRNYISYAMTLLQEKGAKKIVLKATGRAINKTVMIAELIMVYGALRMTVKIFLMWNSKMVIDGGEDTTVATSWLEASNLVTVPCFSLFRLIYLPSVILFIVSGLVLFLQEKGAKKIVLKATGRAINKTVMIAELIMVCRSSQMICSDSVYGALRMTVKIFLMWNSKMVIDGGEDTTVATSWLEASNLVVVPCIWLLLS